ncbi:MAG: neuromedin U [Verrucomicrobiota bacterium]
MKKASRGIAIAGVLAVVPVLDGATGAEMIDPAVAMADADADAVAQASMAGEDLAKASQNPVSSLISVPLENNFFFGIGPSDSMAYAMIAKPVIPMQLGDINLVNRFIFPVLYTEGQDTEDVANVLGVTEEAVQIGFTSGGGPDFGSKWGVGDLTYQGFFTAAEPKDVIVGIGPALTFPTHSDDRFGSDKWSAGPAVVVLTMPGNWVVGCLLQHSWSYAGPDDAADVNKSTFQYFLNYNFEDGWYASMSPVITKNWEGTNGNRWTVPVGGGIGKLHKFGDQPVDFKLLGYYNVAHPEFGADWQLQFTVKFLFPQ